MMLYLANNDNLLTCRREDWRPGSSRLEISEDVESERLQS